MIVLNKRIILASFSLIFIFLIIILGLVFIRFYREYSGSQARRSERMDRLRILLCEEIKLGMTKDQVVSILEQKGEMSINGNYDEPNLNLDFVYVDPILNEYYGRFGMVISDYIYVSSHMPVGFEEYETICSLR